MRVIVLALLAGLAPAQNHVNGYVGTSGSNVYFVQGIQVSTLNTGSSSHYGCVMGPANQLLYVVSTACLVLKVDPVTQAVVGTLASGLSSPYDIVVDGNGDAFVNSSTVLWKLPQTGGVTTVATGLTGMNGGADVDIDSGDIILQSGSGTDPAVLVKRDGSAVTTLGTGADARYGHGPAHSHSATSTAAAADGDFSPCRRTCSCSGPEAALCHGLAEQSPSRLWACTRSRWIAPARRRSN